MDVGFWGGGQTAVETRLSFNRWLTLTLVDEQARDFAVYTVGTLNEVLEFGQQPHYAAQRPLLTN